MQWLRVDSRPGEIFLCLHRPSSPSRDGDVSKGSRGRVLSAGRQGPRGREEGGSVGLFSHISERLLPLPSGKEFMKWVERNQESYPKICLPMKANTKSGK